jgi:hypothetical protein
MNVTALELFDLRKQNPLSTRAYRMAAEQHSRVASKVQLRMVTTLLLNSSANVLGHGVPPSPQPTLAGMMNGVTRWHAR